MAGDVFDAEPAEVKQFRHRQSRQAVELTRILDEVAPKPELVVALDPGDPGAGQDVADGAEDFLADLDLLAKVFAGARHAVKAGDLPEVLEIAVQDQPGRLLAAQETPE